MGWIPWALAVAGLCCCLALAVVVTAQRRRLTAARAEAEQLRAMVKQRVERPNVFSHEVRTPLTLIAGAAELLAEETPGPLTEDQREFVATITTNARRVSNLADDLLAEARIDATLFELHLESLDLRALVRNTVREARRLHSALIRLDCAGAPIPLLADRQLLGQAVWNLVNNACRHAASEVTVSASVTESEAVVAVTDDGAGISSTQRAGLFQPFATDGPHGGTGLGLMITERIVAQHSGRMYVDSVPGRGTTFYFTLPVEAPRGGRHD